MLGKGESVLPLVASFALGAVLAPPLPAQNSPAPTVVVSPIENVDFDRPEAWAMKYFASVALFTGFTPPENRRPGSLEIGVEAGWVPHLSAAERTVGFNGVKTEDLNRTAVMVRPRLTVGLPAQLSLTAAWVPPVTLDGVRTNLFAVGLERPLVKRDRWGLGARLYGQVGEIEGDLTCSEDDVSSEPGSPGNPFGCRERSDDTAGLLYGGFELVGSHTLGGNAVPRLHLGLAANYMDLEFQVDALTFGVRDRTLLLTDGWTWSLNAGASWPLADKTRLGVQAFYSPLSVDRPILDVEGIPMGIDSQNDDLFNLRVMVGFAVW